MPHFHGTVINQMYVPLGLLSYLHSLGDELCSELHTLSQLFTLALTVLVSDYVGVCKAGSNKP